MSYTSIGVSASLPGRSNVQSATLICLELICRVGSFLCSRHRTFAASPSKGSLAGERFPETTRRPFQCAFQGNRSFWIVRGRTTSSDVSDKLLSPSVTMLSHMLKRFRAISLFFEWPVYGRMNSRRLHAFVFVS